MDTKEKEKFTGETRGKRKQNSQNQPHLQLVLSLPSAFSGSESGLNNVKESNKPQAEKVVGTEKEKTACSDLQRTDEMAKCTKSPCCNCNSFSNEWTKLQDFTTFRFFHTTAKKMRNERLVVLDVLRSLFHTGKGDLQASDDSVNGRIMCNTCVGSLKKLFQLYTEFISLSVLSNASLSNILTSSPSPPQVPQNNTQETQTKETSYIGDKDDKKTSLKQGALKFLTVKEKRVKMRSRKSNPSTKEKEPKIVKSNSTIEITTLDLNAKVNQDSESNDSEMPLQICETPQHSQDTPIGDGGEGTTSNEIQCDRCQRCFKSHGALKVHLASHLREDRKFTCKDCSKGFRSQKALDWHHQVDHDGHKPFQCSYEGCGKRFRLKKKLLLHCKVIHEKKKPHPCPKCEKSFRTKYDLKVHDVGKHMQGDNSVGCSKCRRKFSSRDELEKHVVSHEEDKPHKCLICSKGFQSLSRLKLHSKSHDEVPSFICSVCGKAYKHKRDLLLHEVIHQDESNFRFGCGDCSRRFYRIDLLRNHQSNESHFSPEVIGPSITKFIKNINKREERKSQSQNGPPEGPTRKAKKSCKKKAGKPREEAGAAREFPSTPSSLVEIETDSTFATNASDTLEYKEFTSYPITSASIFSEGGTPAGVSKDQILSSLKGDVFAGNGSDSTLSLQPISILTLPNENNSVLSISKEVFDRNLHTFDISAGAEQIGIDVIHAFINNYN